LRGYPKGTSLGAEAFSSYVMERGGAKVDSHTDPFVITVYRPGKAPERWELKKRRRGDVFWLRR
jgi:hypothetical protein